MQRLPVVMVENQQLATTYPAVVSAQYATPANTRTTISSATVNNTSAGAVKFYASIVPAAGAQANANEIVSGMSIPLSGSAPTVLSALVGQTLMPGEVLLLKSDTATALTPRISGYETTL